MANTNYELRYLLLFYRDLEEKIVYIAETLQNPQAANNLLSDLYWLEFVRLFNCIT